MQLKKTPREVRFGDARTQYQEEPMNEESAHTEFGVDPQQVTRTRRPEFEPETAIHTPPASRASSLVDAHSTFDGKYETEQDLRVEGSVSGEVICRGLITIERDAAARAKIQTHDAEIRGRLEGDIVCTGRLLLTSTAVVIGTMTAGSLVVEEGASVSGKVETSTTLSAPKTAAAASAAPSARVTPIAVEQATEAPPAPAAATGRPGRREVPSFALVSSDDRASLDRN